jgi:hypothetical protein
VREKQNVGKSLLAQWLAYWTDSGGPGSIPGPAILSEGFSEVFLSQKANAGMGLN